MSGGLLKQHLTFIQTQNTMYRHTIIAVVVGAIGKMSYTVDQIYTVLL